MIKNMGKRKKALVPSKAKEQAEAREEAMPDVKKLVKKHGRVVIQHCINQLKDYESKVKQLEKLKKDTELLEAEIK